MTLLKGKGVSGLSGHTLQKVNNRPFEELTVVKKTGRKSSFDREKLSKSIYVALKKRNPVLA